MCACLGVLESRAAVVCTCMCVRACVKKRVVLVCCLLSVFVWVNSGPLSRQRVIKKGGAQQQQQRKTTNAKHQRTGRAVRCGAGGAGGARNFLRACANTHQSAYLRGEKRISGHHHHHMTTTTTTKAGERQKSKGERARCVPLLGDHLPCPSLSPTRGSDLSVCVKNKSRGGRGQRRPAHCPPLPQKPLAARRRAAALV